MFLSLNSLGSMVIDVYGDRLDAVFIDASATVMDSFTMVKGVDTLPPVIIFAEGGRFHHRLRSFRLTSGRQRRDYQQLQHR